MANIQLSDRPIIKRRVNETSARDHGIEFVTPSNDESSYGTGKAKVLGFDNQRHPSTMLRHTILV